MLRVVIGYGLIAGLLVSVNFFWVLTSDPASHTGSGYVYGYATMIIALTAVFLGIKHYRDKALGGVIRFGQAVLVGLGISAVAILIYVFAPKDPWTFYAFAAVLGATWLATVTSTRWFLTVS